jgi:hypothetical protein
MFFSFFVGGRYGRKMFRPYSPSFPDVYFVKVVWPMARIWLAGSGLVWVLVLSPHFGQGLRSWAMRMRPHDAQYPLRVP